MLKFLQFFFIPIIISINSNNFNKLINKSEYIDFKIEEKTVFQYLINLFNRNEKIQIYNYNDSNYDYQKTIEDNLKKQIINIINKKPFVKISDSSGDKIYFIKQKYLDFKFKLNQYNEFKNYLEVELWYGNLHNDIEIKLEEQISSDNIIDALIHKITLENDGNLIFINPKISEQYWLQSINEAIKNYTTKPKITINNSIINIQGNDINIISFKINDVVNNKLSLMKRFKEIKKYFHFKTKYYWDHKTNKNFFISKLKNINININTPKEWDNTIITLIKDEMIEIANPEIINHNGFKIDLNLDKYINIILKEPFTIHNSKKKFNIAIKYLNEEIIHTKIFFNGNVSEVNQELLKNIKETLENNISFDLAEINFSNSNNEILTLKEIINKTLNEQVTKNSLNPIFPHKIINNTTIINYWLKNEYQIDNFITEFIIKIKENHSQQDIKASIPLITTSNNNLEVKWNNIFQDNFIALNEMNPINKAYFIKASAFRELYYENYYLRPEIELHNILANFKNYWYIKAIWQEILETFNKKIIYENKKIISANQFQFKLATPTHLKLEDDITTRYANKIKHLLQTEITNKNNQIAKNNYNAIIIETEIKNYSQLKPIFKNEDNHFIFVIPILIDIEINE